jgi:hypothetical protein
LKELLVAYDFSAAADSSLKYAVMLSKRFGSFIHLIGVQSPAEYSSALEAGPLAMEMSQRDLQFGLQEVEQRLRAEGIRSDSVRRIGNISDTIEGAILEHTPTFFSLALTVTVLLTGRDLDQPPSICCGQSVARYSLWDRMPSSATVKPVLLSGFFVLRAHLTLLTVFSVLLAIWLAKWERIWSSLMWWIPRKRMYGLDNAAKNGLLNCASEASK